MAAFQRWCRERQVRAYGNVRMVSNLSFARCLQVNSRERMRGLAPIGGREAEGGTRTVIEPGQGIITVPLSACFNFLTVAREMGEAPDSVFPIQLNWMNYNERLPFLRSAASFEIAQAGWMVRISALSSFCDADTPATTAADPTAKVFVHESGSVDFAPYINYLLEDTRGRDGIAQGVSREREEESGLLDHYFSEMATDCCEDPEVFLEKMFISLAALMHRSQPIESEAIKFFMRGSSSFFKVKTSEMFVPTLMPLIDCVPQREDGDHNTTVEFFPYTNEEALKAQLRELRIPFHEGSGELPAVAERVLHSGAVERVVNVEHALMDLDLLRGGGFFALRALQPLEPGDVLYLRRYPWLGGDVGEQQKNAQVAEANRLLSYGS